jgi:hypothetical protein
MHKWADMGIGVLWFDGLPEGITALQRLQHLRLGNCMSSPRTQSISRLTQLSCLEITHDELFELDYTSPADLVVR